MEGHRHEPSSSAPYQHLPSSPTGVLSSLSSSSSSSSSQAPSDFDVPPALTCSTLVASDDLRGSDQGHRERMDQELILGQKEMDHHPLHFIQIQEDEGVPRMRCLICTEMRALYFCSSCIKNGDFTSSQSDQVLKERFAEKKLKRYKLEEEQKETFQKIERLLDRQVEMDIFQEKANRYTSNLANLRLSLEAKKEELDTLRSKLKSLSDQHQNSAFIKRKVREKMTATEAFVQQIKGRSVSKKSDYERITDFVKQETWDRVYQLRTHIFPIETYSEEENSDSLLSRETTPLLSYSGDSTGSGSGFASDGSGHEVKYVVVEPWLYASADYSGYNEWAAVHKDIIPGATSWDSGQRNPAFRTSAALGYAAQMVGVLAGYLNVRLPKRLTFSDFYTTSSANGNDLFLSEDQFNYRVAKLNANIVHLCLSQNVDPYLLHPTHTVKNLIKVLDPTTSSELGRMGPVIVESLFLENLEGALSEDLSKGEEPDEYFYGMGGDDAVDYDLEDFDWESIPNMPYMGDSQQTASLATGLMSSAWNMWRTYTGQQ